MTVEIAPYTDDACREVLELLVARMYPECGTASLDIKKLAGEIDQVFREGFVINVRDERNLLVGSMGIVIGDLLMYSSDVVLGDKWNYVLPEARYERVGMDLALALRREADKRKVAAYMGIVNPNRRTRPTFRGAVAVVAGYRILGTLFRVK